MHQECQDSLTYKLQTTKRSYIQKKSHLEENSETNTDSSHWEIAQNEP